MQGLPANKAATAAKRNREIFIDITLILRKSFLVTFRHRRRPLLQSTFVPPVARPAGSSPDELRAFIEDFLGAHLLEPGDDVFPLAPGSYALEIRSSRLSLDIWDDNRNLSRRVLAAEVSAAGRLELTVERFARRQGVVYLLDMQRRSGAQHGRRSERLIFRERFRLLLRRQFPEWNLPKSAPMPISNTVSRPRFRRISQTRPIRLAAIACPLEGDTGAVLTFGLIWLSICARGRAAFAIEGLAIDTAAGQERTIASRLRHLDPASARFALFTYSPHDEITGVDPQDCGNLDTRPEPCRRAEPNRENPWRRIAALPAVESIARHDGRVSLRVRGVEFATPEGRDLHFGLNPSPGRRHAATERHIPEIERLVEERDLSRSADAESRNHPLYRQFPEA